MRRLNDVPVPEPEQLSGGECELTVHLKQGPGAWAVWEEYHALLVTELGSQAVSIHYGSDFGYPIMEVSGDHNGGLEIAVFGPKFKPREPEVPVEEAIRREAHDSVLTDWSDQERAAAAAEAPEAGDVDAEPGA